MDPLQSAIVDVLDQQPETAGLTWLRKTAIADTIARRLDQVGAECIHIPGCDCFERDW
jgi:hypothetical protein